MRRRRPKATRTRLSVRAAALAAGLAFPDLALAQTCPAALDGATRLVLVTADGMNTQDARLQTFVRSGAGDAWKAASASEPVVIGRAGMAWAPSFRAHARAGEPIKREGDKRAPAGIYSAGRSFGTLASPRSGYLQIQSDTVCVDDSASPAYNTITTRDRVGPKVSVENMSRMLPMYRRGIVVDYPTDARARAGSCIFIHVWKTPKTGTAGCVALPEARVEALQDFVEPGAAIAILPRDGLARLRGCLRGVVASR